MAHWLFQKLFQKTDVKHLGSIPGQGQCCGNFDLFCVVLKIYLRIYPRQKNTPTIHRMQTYCHAGFTVRI